MRVTDAIADALTRIRNALSAHHISVEIPASNVKIAILKILCNEGYLKKFVVSEDGKQGMVKVFLKYNHDQTAAINCLKRISKPGMRVYAKTDALPKVIGGLGIALISTSRGIMTDRRARKSRLGGEVLAYIW
ncbi:MAG: 30S ribosomal protein S8 [Clostridia bacterium]|nr:30S ribosomal protein S8 [Clostridia bacterium]